MSRRIVFALFLLCCGITASTGAQEKAAALPFSKARQAGKTLYVSGQLPRDAAGNDVRGSVTDEARQVMRNIGAILQENGYSFDDVVMVNVYLQDMAYYQEFNAEYARYFDRVFPARACVGGQQIAFGFRVEVSCIAYKD